MFKYLFVFACLAVMASAAPEPKPAVYSYWPYSPYTSAAYAAAPAYTASAAYVAAPAYTDAYTSAYAPAAFAAYNSAPFYYYRR